MRILKWLGATLAVYVVFVLAFEAGYLGILQPSFEEQGIPMLMLTTTDDAGSSHGTNGDSPAADRSFLRRHWRAILGQAEGSHDRMLARFETDERLYVSAHHWTRGWHQRAVDNPNVQVRIDGHLSDFVAVPVDGEEFQRVAAEHPLPFMVRFLMGFPPPRDVLRLDPVAP